MHVEQRKSGLVVASDRPPKPTAPPEPTARKALRRSLAAVRDSLCGFEQTTHGIICAKPVTIEYVCEELVKAYNEPDAYHLSNLSQVIGKFCSQEQE